jgi:ribosomal protein S18 acetylase RimI-like enzyme
MSHPAASIVAYLRANLEQRAGAARIGPFFATFDPDSDNRYRNYAVPDDAAEPTVKDVHALLRAFEEHHRSARLEYVADLAPRVWPVLSACGFVEEGLVQLMILGDQGLRTTKASAEITFAIVSAEQDIEAAARVQNEAYGEPPTSSADVARLRSLIQSGGAVALARSGVTQEAVGAGLYSAPWRGLTEIAALGVRAPDRRRGIGAHLTALLTQHALSRGLDRPFLMAAHESEARLYTRIGFAECARMLHASLQPK